MAPLIRYCLDSVLLCTPTIETLFRQPFIELEIFADHAAARETPARFLSAQPQVDLIDGCNCVGHFRALAHQKARSTMLNDFAELTVGESDYRSAARQCFHRDQRACL